MSAETSPVQAQHAAHPAAQAVAAEVVTGFSSIDGIDLAEELRTLNKERRQRGAFRADFAFAVQALLTSAGEVSEDKARAWVEASIKPE